MFAFKLKMIILWCYQCINNVTNIWRKFKVKHFYNFICFNIWLGCFDCIVTCQGYVYGDIEIPISFCIIITMKYKLKIGIYVYIYLLRVEKLFLELLM